VRPIATKRPPALALVVEERLREAIVDGTLELGEMVSEDKLATRLGVSRTPVREALTALQMQGLVVIQPQRGSHIFQPTDADLAEICEYRAIIELSALRLAMQRDPAATIARLAAAQSRMMAAEAAGRSIEAARADADFHHVLIAHCGNARLAEAYKLVSGQVGAIRTRARQAANARRYSGSQHDEIIAALETSDVDAASRVLEHHIRQMQRHFAEAREKPPTGEPATDSN
jgi:DNA-binding GntR family transcriptional regulator